MSSTLLTSTITTTATTNSSGLRHYHNLNGKGVATLPYAHNTRSPLQVYACCKLQQNKEGNDHGKMHRRNVLVGLGGLCGVAVSLLNKNMIANATGVQPLDNEDSDEMKPVYEFGSQPRALDKIIRALVERPKKKIEVEAVIVDGIEIPNDNPIRFDVYITKPYGNLVSPDLGEFAGSFVDIAHPRKNKRKGTLELGITHLVERIGAENSEKLVVTLVPRTGEAIIGGVWIEAM